jgi:hypothetical protein
MQKHVDAGLSLASLRESQIHFTKLLIGRTKSHFPVLYQESIELIKHFVDHAQKDTYLAYEARFELADLVIISSSCLRKLFERLIPSMQETAEQTADEDIAVMLRRAEELIAEADVCKSLRVPILPHPMNPFHAKVFKIHWRIAQVKLQMKRLATKKLKAAADCGATSDEMGADGAHVEATKGARVLFKCWACDKDGPLVCTGCKTARFCSHTCQHRVWKQHKQDCRALAGKQR